MLILILPNWDLSGDSIWVSRITPHPPGAESALTVNFIFEVLVHDTQRKRLVHVHALVHEHLQFPLFGEVEVGVDYHLPVRLRIRLRDGLHRPLRQAELHRILQKPARVSTFLAQPRVDPRRPQPGGFVVFGERVVVGAAADVGRGALLHLDFGELVWESVDTASILEYLCRGGTSRPG